MVAKSHHTTFASLYSPEAKNAGAALGALALHGDLGRRRLGLRDVGALLSLDEVLVVILEDDGRVVLVEVELKRRRGNFLHIFESR